MQLKGSHTVGALSTCIAMPDKADDRLPKKKLIAAKRYVL